MQFLSTISVLAMVALLPSAIAIPTFECDSKADCPASLPVCCGFAPQIVKHCLPEGSVC
ncbi:hypothetical protein BDV18DRAFT_128567 [Aspergillus unguis]